MSDATREPNATPTDPWQRGLASLEQAARDMARDDAAAAQAAAVAALADFDLGDEAEAPAWAGEKRVEAHLLALRAAFLQDDVEAALRSGAAALRVALEHQLTRLAARAHNDMAAVYGARGMVERALHHLRAGVRILDDADLPVAPSLTNNLGNVYLELERTDEALACFRRAHHDHRANGDAFGAAIARSNEGRALAAQGQHRLALEALQDALAAFAALGQQAYRGATLGKLGEVLAAAGDDAGAEDAFREALAVFAGGVASAFEADVHVSWGRFLHERGRHAEAREALETALQAYQRQGADAGMVAPLQHLAEVLRHLERHEEAYERLRAYVDLRERLEQARGALLVRASLVELESGLASDHELHVVTREALADANRALRDQAEQLERLSTTDELTGAHNRRFLTRRIDEESRRAARDGTELSLVLVDVDNFKAVNDDYSHLAGDAVLRGVARLLGAVVRRSDVVARWGGEEFALLLPGCAKQDAAVVAEKARVRIAEQEWREAAGALRVTVSVGVASLGEVGADTHELVRLADRRLYAAKNAGRNRVEVHATP